LILLSSSNTNETGLINESNETNDTAIDEFISSSPKTINNPLTSHPLKRVKSPSQNIACVCSCSCSNASNLQNVSQTPLKNVKSYSKMSTSFHSSTKNSNPLTQSTNDPLNRRQKQAMSLPKLNKNNNNNNEPTIFHSSNLENSHCDCIRNCVHGGNLDLVIQNNFSDIIQTIKNTIEKSEIRLRENEKREIIQNEWSDIAMILDRLLCYFFSVATLAICALIFLNSPHSLRSW
jgi:hypothetical protein